MNLLKLLPTLFPTLLCGMATAGQNAEEVPAPARARGSDEDGHRYYPPRRSGAAPGWGRDVAPKTPAEAEFPRHQIAGLSKAEKNAAKRERRARRST